MAGINKNDRHHFLNGPRSFCPRQAPSTFDAEQNPMEMKQFNKYRLIILILLLPGFFVGPVVAQGNYKLAGAKPSKLSVLGTSNVHDWTMTATEMESQGDFRLNASGQLVAVNALSFSMNDKSLKSGHDSMDDRTYNTMKADRFPKVTYQLSNETVTALPGNRYEIRANGQLSIAGVTRPVTLNVTAAVDAAGTITCTGSEPVKLSDYGINPPTFMLGALKVKNDLNIQFELNYEPIH